jgi:predicted NACHT family NTPase
MVRLRDYHGRALPKGHELLSTTSSALTELDPGDWFKDRLHRGRFLFLIDGLDEVSEDQRCQVAYWIEDLILASPSSSYLVTTRPSAVEGGYLSSLHFDEYFLKPMTPREVHSFVEYWHDAAEEAAVHDEDRKRAISQKRNHLTRLLEENRDLIRLSSTPLLCAVICTLNLDGRLQLISDRVDLYRTASQLLYHDRDKKKEVSDPMYGALTRKQKEKILSYVAYQFIKNGITSTDLRSLTEMIMRARGSDDSDEAARQAKVLADAIILRSGILNEVSVDSVQFLHKTFQEYFAALEVVYRQTRFMWLRISTSGVGANCT